MRKVEIGSSNYTEVFALDEKGAGNANHIYTVKDKARELETDICRVRFQEGPIKENGVNGIHNEDLISIVIDRLHGFQSGDYSCRENAMAITKLEEAMHWLNHRTQSRKNRGVEGTSIV